MPNIRVSQDVLDVLRGQGAPGESGNSILLRLLGLPPEPVRARRPSQPTSGQPADYSVLGRLQPGESVMFPWIYGSQRFTDAQNAPAMRVAISRWSKKTSFFLQTKATNKGLNVTRIS